MNCFMQFKKRKRVENNSALSGLSTSDHDCLYARTVLWLMTFTATAVGFIFMVNINISIVSMVRDHHLEEPGTSLSSECINNSSLPVPEENISNLNSTIPDDELRFDWDEKQQSLILGSYYWLNPVLMIPAGVMVQRFGPKLMIGLSNLIPCLLNFLMPFCARLDYRAVVFLRVLMGLVADLKWSALNNLAANWIPPDERSKFVIAYLGSSLGVGIAYPVCGFVISLWDWPAVFHVTGLIGILWFIIWWFLVYDSPSQHPRISTSEKEYILKCVSNTVTRKKVKVPWKSILLSRPLWINNLAMWGYVWALFTLMAQPPSYFKIIHGWDIRKTGLLTGAPHFLCMCIAILVSTTADYLLRNNIMTRTNVRKMATSICLIGQGVLVLGLAFSGCNALTAIVCLLVGTALGGAITAGAMANTIDLAPNHAGVLMALSNCINVLPGFLSPLIVGVLTYQNQTVGQWFWVYMITAIMLLVPGIVHLLYGTSELQEWNSSPDEKPNHELEKMFSRVSETEKEIESQNAVINGNKDKT